MPRTENPILTSRFDRALLLASELHRDHTRKHSGCPFISHLFQVAALVLEAGGDEDTASAAMLHDAVEDRGGAQAEARIRAELGDAVADLVLEVTETDADPKPPWRARKVAYLSHLNHSSDRALLLALADKVANSRNLLDQLRADGDAAWQHFNAGPSEQIWWHNQLLDCFLRRAAELPVLATPILLEFSRLVEQITIIAGNHPEPAATSSRREEELDLDAIIDAHASPRGEDAPR